VEFVSTLHLDNKRNERSELIRNTALITVETELLREARIGHK